MANRIKGITVEIGGNVTGLSKALGGVNKEISSTQKQLKDVERLLKLDPKNTELLSQKQKLLAESVSETKTKLETLKEAEKQVQQQMQEGKASQEQYDALKREIILTEQELEELEKKAENSSVALQKIGMAGESVSKFGEKVSSAGEKLLPVTAAVGGIAAAGVAAFNELDKGYDTIITKTGATGEALDSLQKSMENVFADIPTDAETAGIAIGEVNTRFGKTGEELESLSKSFIEFAEINGTDLNSAIDSVDSIMTKFGVDSSKTEQVLGLLTKAGQDTGISMESLESSLQTNGATLKEMGLDLTSSVNLLAQFEANGVDASAALAGLKKAQQNATKEGKNLGEALGETIEKVKNAGTETEALQIATELFGKKGAAEMTQAIREGRLSVDDLAVSLSEYGTVVEDTFNATLDPQDQAKIALNNLKIAGADLGDTMMTGLAPIIDTVVEKVKQFTEWFSGLNETQKQTILIILAVVAAIGPLLIFVGNIISGIGGVITMISKVGPALSAMQGVFSSVFSFIAANPVVLLIAAIVAMVALIATKGDEIKGILDGIDNFLQNIFAIDWCNIFGPVLGDALNGFFSNVKNIWDSIKQVFDGIIDFISGVFSGDWSRAWNGIKNIFSGIFNGLVAVAKSPINGIIGLINGVISGLNWMISGINSISFDVPSWVPGIGGKHLGFNLSQIGKIAYLYNGGVLSKGSAIVGENGPELLTMSGSQAIVQPLTNSTTNHNLGGVNIYVYGSPGQDIAELADEVMDRINDAVDRKGAVWG